MEASWSILPLGFHRIPRSHRNNHSTRIHLLQTNSHSILSLWLCVLPVRLPIPPILHLRSLLDRPLALLPMEMGLLTPLLGRMGLRRPRILHPQRTIRPWRNHKGPVRPDDARPTNTQPSRLGTNSQLGHAIAPSSLSRLSLS